MLPREAKRERSDDSEFLSVKIPVAQHHNRFVYLKNRSGKPEVKNCLLRMMNVAKKRHSSLTFITNLRILPVSGVARISEPDPLQRHSLHCTLWRARIDGRRRQIARLGSHLTIRFSQKQKLISGLIRPGQWHIR